ncbi:pyridine nucleotide-disulfide oxidoreductase [Nocardioides marmoriginsengisoli]|uniref:Tetratricopeptide repeat protein 38 n=1 Tax=Nocardioides marmoriginsengisoli TaxID=661483 RepID=A0A3N0C914_9ACTN|nr:pyridine nucleotide-disulfide oxidoreductase [Nocardioides marmoriginsengisoli]RNL59947.1 pyridine nucleotide-disulfide oxidoreductase [Nocardioides marmoriginsengisoli]
MRTGVLDRRLTTSPEAEQAYREGVDALLQLRQGAVGHFATAITLDPTFAMAHAALALMGHEWCAPVDAEARVAAAALHAGRATDQERSHIHAVRQHLRGDRRAIVQHLDRHPDDAVLLSVAVPTIAFAGVTEVPEDAWQIVESCTRALSGTWFHDGLLAFVRQEQGRFDDAMHLANLSLAAEPSSGHAAHARAHAHYETGDHAAGLTWLDTWMEGDGRQTDNLAHYAWHAALHELSDGDLTAVDARYRAQLAPDHVSGCRSLVDTGSLLWRWSLTPGAHDVPSVQDGTDVPASTLLRPTTPFVGLHAAVALAAADDASGLRSLACWAEAHENPVQRAVVAPLANALSLLVLDQPSACADELIRINPQVWRVGGSDAQREVVEETLVTALLRAGRYDEARALIDDRLDRRHCRRDQWWRDATIS